MASRRVKPAAAAVPLLDAQRIGREARSTDADHSAVKLWLRLLSCSTQIEQDIRTRLRQRFGASLPRFDYLAQLERHPDGLRMSALSRCLMVTGGNVTGLTDQLVADGWVERTPDPLDGRSLLVRLTDAGRAHFLRMAAEHEAWLVAMFDGFGATQRDALHTLLGRLRVHLAQQPVAALLPAPAAAQRVAAQRAPASHPAAKPAPRHAGTASSARSTPRKAR